MPATKKTSFKTVVLVCGLSGSGKSELVDALGKALKLDVVHTSSVFRMLQTKNASKIKLESGKKNTGFWESAEGKSLMNQRLKNRSLDKQVDELLMARLVKGNVAMDSWVMPWLFKGRALRIWLDAPISSRAKRLSLRNHQSFVEALSSIREKEQKTISLYQDMYGFDMTTDRHVFDLTINTEYYTQEEVVSLALAVTKEWIKIARKK